MKKNRGYSTGKGLTNHPDYCDLASLPFEIAQQAMTSDIKIKGTVVEAQFRRKIVRSNNFPEILYNMLQKTDIECNQIFSQAAVKDRNIVEWLHHGRAFTILDQNWFVLHILPIYFPTQKKYASFRRQLNLYGFLKLSLKCRQDTTTYYHKCFLRGRRDLCALIQRIAYTGSLVRQRMNPDSEPDFDSYAPVISVHSSLDVSSNPRDGKFRTINDILADSNDKEKTKNCSVDRTLLKTSLSDVFKNSRSIGEIILNKKKKPSNRHI